MSELERHYINGVEHIEVPHPYSQTLHMIDAKRDGLIRAYGQLQIERRDCRHELPKHEVIDAQLEITGWMKQISSKIKELDATHQWVLEIGSINAIQE
jgi:hypothetical protein